MRQKGNAHTYLVTVITVIAILSVAVPVVRAQTADDYPVVQSISPASGEVGTVVTITGTRFGATHDTPGKEGKVAYASFGGLDNPCDDAYNYMSWTDTSITCKVPKNAKTGLVYVIRLDQNQASSNAKFTVGVVKKPRITRISPKTGTAGTLVTIKGKNFGKKSGKSYVKFWKKGVASRKCKSWKGTKIEVRVPKGLYGKVNIRVCTSAGKSSGKPFEVTK